MKILMLSIFSSHFFNWTEQLKDSGHQVYWLDVLDSNTNVEKINFVHQIRGWRYKKNYPGRYFVKKRLSVLNNLINRINERNLSVVFEQKLKEINPDVVHSFAMHFSCFPIHQVMQKYPDLKWVYSSWGSDLFFYQHQSQFREKTKKIFSRIDYMFSDCHRDLTIARDLGFRGEFLGVFPGRGGFDFRPTDGYLRTFEEKDHILIKGYEGKHGRAIAVLKALENLSHIQDYQVWVFGASDEVVRYFETSDLRQLPNVQVQKRISHQDVMKLLGKAIIFVGNSQSDGIPNTLLEAVVMGAFPIQSNPGGASAEMIDHGKNGFLIQNPEDPEGIRNLIERALNDKGLVYQGIIHNLQNIKPKLERDYIKHQVLQKYSIVENEK